MARCRKRRDLPALEVVGADWAFFTSSKCGDDTTNGSGLLKEWQKIDEKLIAGISDQSCGEREAF